MEILGIDTDHATNILKLLISLDNLKIDYRMPLISLVYSGIWILSMLGMVLAIYI